MLRWCDSFQGYDGPTILETNLKWDDWTGSSGQVFITSGGPFGGTCLQLTGYDSRVLRKNLDNQATFIQGIRFKQIGAFNDNGHILECHDAGTRQVAVGVNSAGKLVAKRDTTILGTGTTVMVPGLWYYIEFKATIHNTTGALVVVMNGVTEINVTGANTRVTANNYANQVQIGRRDGGFSQSGQFADYYCCDSVSSGVSGAPNNDFLGDVRVEGLVPNGNGNSSQFVGSDSNSTDNYLLVDETTGTAPNGDTDYVESSTVGDKDTYAYQNLSSASGVVYGIQVNNFARKTDAGTRKFKNVVRLSTTEQDGPEYTLLASYRYFSDIREADPGGSQWTVANVNAMEAGQKVTA